MVRVNNVDLYYEFHGPEDGELLILNNGVFMSTASWVFQLPELSRRFRVLTYDIEPRTGPIRVQNVVDGLDAVLKAESASGPATLARVLGEVLGGTGPGPNREAVPATGGKQ